MANNIKLSFEEGWPVLQEGVNKLIDMVEGVREDNFSSKEYMNLYERTCYNMCHHPQDNAQKLYDQYKKVFEDYITSKVLPSLWEKKGESLLRELVKRWKNHKLMTRWLSRFFHYLERYFISRQRLPGLNEASHLTFYNMVYGEMKDQVRNDVLSMINQEREGEQIDQALVKDVLGIYVGMGEGFIEYYEKDFEDALLNQTTTFYSQKAVIWIKKESYKEYTLRVDECLKQERDRVSCYLPERSNEKLLKIVEHELLSNVASELEEKKQLEAKPDS